MCEVTKRISLTGIKPTGMPHLGNFVGAIRATIEMADSGEYEGYYFIADYHCLTTVHDNKVYKKNIHAVAAAWLAMGLDAEKAALYRQSDIPEICELSWILSCFTAKGLMNRAHAYKALCRGNEENGKDRDQGVSMGLYGYPILMASDILSVQTDVVPVGSDQLQHIEMTRDIAESFNHRYGPILKLPKAQATKKSFLLGLDGRKMSKSYNNHIPLFVPEKTLKKMIGKIVTDSSPPSSPKEPDRSLIFDIYRQFASEEEIKKMRDQYKGGISWGEAKNQLFQKLNDCLKYPREKYHELMADTSKIEVILKAGAEKARARSIPLLNKVKKAIGA